MADASIRPRLVAVRENVNRFQLQVWNLVQVLHREPGTVRRSGSLRADVGKHAELAVLDRSIAIDSQFHLIPELRTMRAGYEIFLAGIHRLDRAARDLRKNGRVNLR